MIMFVIFCAIVGAALGSFCCCQAWRIHYGAEGKNLGKRSVCLYCGRKLKWNENIPIVSWLVQRGRCRGCKKKIGSMELISEILGAVFGGALGVKFLDSFIRIVFRDWQLWSVVSKLVEPEAWIWGIEVLLIVVIFTTIGVIAIYDSKWGEMPTKLLYSVVIEAVFFAVLMAFKMGISRVVVDNVSQIVVDCSKLGDYLVSVGESILILAGTYYALYKISKEKWVGGGDWILCLAIALVLGKPFLALLELTISNFLGLAVMLPKKRRKKLIPFGPFLAIAFAIIFCFFVNI